jgi:hypothetical protein
MLTNYDLMPDSSRVWIYQSNRSFSNEELVIVKSKVEAFINNWQRHGEDLKASYKIMYNQFIILFVDEEVNSVSGCSIDASVNLMKQLESDFNVDLTNKLNVSFKDGNNINIVRLSDFQTFAKENKITSKTIVFNNLVTTKSDFKNNWEVTAENSWHKRFVTV